MFAKISTLPSFLPTYQVAGGEHDAFVAGLSIGALIAAAEAAEFAEEAATAAATEAASVHGSRLASVMLARERGWEAALTEAAERAEAEAIKAASEAEARHQGTGRGRVRMERGDQRGRRGGTDKEGGGYDLNRCFKQP